MPILYPSRLVYMVGKHHGQAIYPVICQSSYIEGDCGVFESLAY